MVTRILSGLMILVVLFALVLVNLWFPFGMNIMIAICAFIMVYEIAKVFHLHRNWYYLAPSLCFGAVLPLVCDLPWVHPGFWFGACSGLYLFVLVCIMLFFHEKVQLKQWVTTTALIVMITIAMTTIIGVRDLGGQHGAFYVFITMMASWVADCGAYFAGSFFGKHKLCPKLSPKKTVEGVFGGFFLNVLAMLVYGTFYNLIFYRFTLSVSYLSLVLIGLICTVVSIVGDLCFSLIKRKVGIKDYGNIIPGHGGFVDRFDSTVFVAPFLFFFLQLLPMIR